ncbi:hypothetical protein R69658_07150 [Paraburkholderia aspalathi]|uniref:Uncharacterized protein n=1 Tax=Paraburkholderia aspalathi TaxID=1324617 RepID=A0ABN7NA99_9BURK|nr:hypothetical protein [Paraburkholderia aspalathi]MBK3865076.1 hypothetical protein [Paraburkholderia aspalathi]CAE6850912.1 hypothetical protein R69658_07150 [Paraburkholderia aspalathi]
MAISEYKSDPIVWMNVTTSANWTRPPVGIVRVEQALCAELSEMLGADRFKTCVWLDGGFVEWVPAEKKENETTKEVVDMILPRTPSFNLARNFIARAINKFKVEQDKSTGEVIESIEIRMPLSVGAKLSPAMGTSLYRSLLSLAGRCWQGGCKRSRKRVYSRYLSDGRWRGKQAGRTRNWRVSILATSVATTGRSGC